MYLFIILLLFLSKTKFSFSLFSKSTFKIHDFIEYDSFVELYGYKDKNIVDVSDPDKNPFDHVIFDSIIERDFAQQCDEDEEVVLYAKLPSAFKIDTPFGTYNPDWMVVIQREGEEQRFYFVAETKGSTDEDQLKGKEKNKIFCGRKHFEVVDTELKYQLAVKLNELKDNCD